ncbi:MAG: MFS transporter [Chloroflexota bacterium]
MTRPGLRGPRQNAQSAQRRTLWRHSNFLKLWGGQAASQIGTEVDALALPLVAVLFLRATPVQMGYLVGLRYVPLLIVGLHAGAIADRFPRRLILIFADFGRAILLASIPVSAVLGLLHIQQLYVVTFSEGILAVFFDAAYLSYLPAVVGVNHLLEGNSKLAMSKSVARSAGPALAGVLVQVLGAPVTVLLDSVSFLVSAVSLCSVRDLESRRPRAQGSHGRCSKE